MPIRGLSNTIISSKFTVTVDVLFKMNDSVDIFTTVII